MKNSNNNNLMNIEKKEREIVDTLIEAHLCNETVDEFKISLSVAIMDIRELERYLIKNELILG